MKNRNINKEENYFIDFVRFICSIVILCYHSWKFTNSGDNFFPLGYLAVDYYFLLSGYLMINTLNNKKYSTSEFISNKIKRLLPGVLFCFFICYLLAYGRNGLDIKTFLSNSVMGDLFFLKAFGTGGAINSAWWYMSAMLFVLFIMYPLAKKYKDNYIYYICPLTIVIPLALKNFFQISFSYHSGVTLIFCNGVFKGFIYVALGSICYDLALKLKKVKLSKIKKLLITFIELLLYIILLLNMQYYYMGTILAAVLLTIDVAISFSNISYTSSIFKHKFWKYLGNYGFYVYLIHESVRRYFDRRNTLVYNEMFPKYAIYSFIIALVVFLLVDFLYPFLKNKFKLQKK